jgi:hypothetical protein
VPGTVDLSAVEGEETHYGQALFPGELQSPVSDALGFTSLTSVV